LSHFYPTERLARTDYNFSQDQSGILLPHTPPAAAAITFQTASPAPLPPRRATFSLNNEAVFTLLVDQTPRRIALLLPPEATRPHKGVLVQVETATATAPGDPRDLGLLFTGIHIHSFEQNRPFWHYPSVFAIQCIVFTILIVSGASLVFAGISLVSLSSVLLVNQRLFILLCMLVIPAALLYRQLPYSDIRERLKQKHLLFGDPYLTIVLTDGIVLLQRTDRVLPASCFGTDWNMSVINDRSYAVAPQV
jgi:hypothetical protein